MYQMPSKHKRVSNQANADVQNPQWFLVGAINIRLKNLRITKGLNIAESRIHGHEQTGYARRIIKIILIHFKHQVFLLFKQHEIHHTSCSTVSTVQCF